MWHGNALSTGGQGGHLGAVSYRRGPASATPLLLEACSRIVCVALAARTRRLFTSPRAMRLVNRGTGAVMASAAAAIAVK